MKEKMTVEQWVALFEETGLDEAARQRWHRLFESRHPESHQSFLEWLGLDPQRIDEIRAAHR